MALDQIPHLPGADPNSPDDKVMGKSDAPRAASHPGAVRLSDVGYDSKPALCGRSSASAFFLQPRYALLLPGLNPMLIPYFLQTWDLLYVIIPRATASQSQPVRCPVASSLPCCMERACDWHLDSSLLNCSYSCCAAGVWCHTILATCSWLLLICLPCLERSWLAF